MRMSIVLIVAFSLIHTLAHGEPAELAAEPPSATAPIFADSFGLNLLQRVTVKKEQGPVLQSAESHFPAADSFGLNRRPTLAGVRCALTPKVAAEPGTPSRRCIEI